MLLKKFLFARKFLLKFDLYLASIQLSQKENI